MTFEAIDIEVTALNSPLFAKEFFLFCSVLNAESSQPLISYQWLKDEKELMSQSSVLSFDSLSLSDIAEYKCKVTLSSSLLPHDAIITSVGYHLMFERKDLYCYLMIIIINFNYGSHL